MIHLEDERDICVSQCALSISWEQLTDSSLSKAEEVLVRHYKSSYSYNEENIHVPMLPAMTYT